MRSFLLASSLILATFAGSAFAQSSRAPAPVPNTSAPSRVATAPTHAADVKVSPAAKDAVQVVNAFMAALAGGQFEAARQLMTPDAVVIANGQVLGDRDGYINGAAKGDAAALSSVQQRDLLRRGAQAGADLGWVVSEKRLLGPAGAKGPKGLLLTETMLLAKTPAGWKITHIHWSGRPAS